MISRSSCAIAMFLMMTLSVCPGCERPTASSDSETEPTPQGRITLDDATDGQTIHATVGQSIVVRLAANASTGYAWSKPDLIGRSVVPDGLGRYEAKRQVDEPRDGAGGIWTTPLLAQSPGTTEVRMSYRRPWETDTPPVRTFALKVVVTDSTPPQAESRSDMQ